MIPEIQDLKASVKHALAEDIGSGDVTAALLPVDLTAEAIIINREPMVVCGIPWVNEVFKEVDVQVVLDWQVKEGSWIEKNSTLCFIRGSARTILTAERTALNFLQTLSATATQTHHFLAKLAGTNTRLLDTRKTLPGLRQAQKYAVACAGGTNHRMGLYDAYLIKENHIKACGGIQAAISRARTNNSRLFVEVEVENLEELQAALQAGADRILLDNFSQDLLNKAVHITNHQCELEASGGIHIDNIASVARTGVDYISVGEITKSIKAIDLSLLIKDVQ